MGMTHHELRFEATDRYNKSARHAELLRYWTRFTGKRFDLLRYEEVASQLHIRQQIPLGFQMIQLDHIVGSVGRYREFTNKFLPRATVIQERWIMVDVTMNSLRGLPPIEVYKIGEGYFVVDGNHRISVARANGNKDIEAHVIECQTAVPITLADLKSNRWLLKAAQTEFLAQTQLNTLRPDHGIELTVPEHYQTLLHHISVHRYLYNQLNYNQWRPLSWEDAVVSWYDTIYMPIVLEMRARRLQSQFPQRTEAELYVQITQYRERVAEEYELAPLGAEIAVAVFAANHSERTIPRFLLTLRQSVRQRLRQHTQGTPVRAKMPLGMTQDEFHALRLRHEAGELSIGEASRKQAQESHFFENMREDPFEAQFATL